MSINIAHVVSSIENRASGVSYCVTSLAAAQRRKEAVTSVLSVGDPNQFGASNFEDRRYPGDFSNIPVLRRLGASRALRRALSAVKYDVVHNHGLWMLPNTYDPSGAALVISPHGMLTSVALSYSRRKKALFRRLFQDRVLAAASLFHATAESEYEDIRRFNLRQPVAIIPNGIDLPDLGPRKSRTNNHTILSLGRIHPKKGLDGLIHAWAEVECAFPNWRLRIVGPDEGGHAAELKGLVQSLGLKRVSIEGSIFGTEKIDLMADADLFVLPSKSENFAITVAESLALGVPVISTKGAPWAGLETHGCGWWVDHGKDTMAAALERAMAQPSKYLHKMGMKGRLWMARDYSWEHVAQMTLDAYRWMMSGGEPPTFILFE